MADIHWLNPVDGDFSTASDWSGGVTPGESDTAYIDAAGGTPYTVTVSTSDFFHVGALEVASTATLDVDGYLASFYASSFSGEIVVGAGGDFAPGARSGGIANSGAISVLGGGVALFSGRRIATA